MHLSNLSLVMDLFVLQRSPQCALTISSLLRMTAQSTSTLSSEVISQQTGIRLNIIKHKSSYRGIRCLHGSAVPK